MTEPRYITGLQIAPPLRHDEQEKVSCLICGQGYSLPIKRQPGVYGSCFVERGTRPTYITVFGAQGGYLTCHGCNFDATMTQYNPVVRLGDVLDIARRALPMAPGIYGNTVYWTERKHEQK